MSKGIPKPECVRNKALPLQSLSEMQLNEAYFSELFSGLTNLIEVNIDEALRVIPVFEKYAYLFKDIVILSPPTRTPPIFSLPCSG